VAGGGILASEPGLGKTIKAVALVALHPRGFSNTGGVHYGEAGQGTQQQQQQQQQQQCATPPHKKARLMCPSPTDPPGAPAAAAGKADKMRERLRERTRDSSLGEKSCRRLHIEMDSSLYGMSRNNKITRGENLAREIERENEKTKESARERTRGNPFSAAAERIDIPFCKGAKEG
jgi:hypothetical protein